MPDKPLIQRRLADRKEITIHPDHLHIRSKSWQDDWEYNLPYEDLGTGIMFRRTKPSLLVCALVVICDAASIKGLWDVFMNPAYQADKAWAIPVFTAILLMSVVVLWQKRQNLIYLTGGAKTISMFGNIPNTETVSAFIDQIHHAKRDQIRARYLPFRDGVGHEEKKEILDWLLDEQVLSSEEHESLLIDWTLENALSSEEPDDLA